MAGSVTGSIGSNDVLLKNMATEETLFQILEALDGATITARPATAGNTAATQGNTKEKDKNTSAIKSSSKALEKMFDGIEGIGRVIRGMDSNINNASFAFQAMSRGSGGFSKAMEFAANSVTQLQEQFSAYGKMMQIGGVVTDDFRDLRMQASALGTDLQGLAKISTEYGTSLKSGSTSVADTLKKMRGQFDQLEDAQITQYGRLGVGMNQITEQMLLTAESQGGYNAVLAKYKGSTGDMNKGMLKSTQELNLFASAIGMNSRMMQEEAAKAAQKIENRVFMANLSDAEKNQVSALQGLTGSFETALSVVRSFKTGFVDEQAASFLATQNIAGLGTEVNNLMGLLKQGKGLPEALIESGLISAANKVDPKLMDQMSTNIKAYASGGSPEAAQGLSNFLTLINNLKGTTPENIQDRMKDLLTPNPKTIDSYSKLLQEQNQLAQSTAALNTQINRMGLSFALALTKTTNATVKAAAGSKEKIIDYYNSLLPEGMKLPPEILSKINDNLEVAVQADIEKYINNKWKETFKPNSTEEKKNEPVVSLRNSGLDKNTGVPVKMADGSIKMLKASDLVSNRNNILKDTNAFGGENNNEGTVATGAMLANRITGISAITAGSDKYHQDRAPGSAHNKGLALDFGIADINGQDKKQTAQATITRMHELLKEYGLTDKDYKILDESKRPDGDAGKHWTAPHIHLELTRESAANKMRDLFKTMVPDEQKQSSNKRNLDADGAVAQITNEETPITVSKASGNEVVNTDNNNNNDFRIGMATQTQEIKNLGRLIENALERHFG
jgi:hypothetical protein